MICFIEFRTIMERFRTLSQFIRSQLITENSNSTVFPCRKARRREKENTKKKNIRFKTHNNNRFVNRFSLCNDVTMYIAI